MGGDDSTSDYKTWLMENVDVSEIMGYLKAEFGKLPQADPYAAEEASSSIGAQQRHAPEDLQRLRNLEWADIANMPALPSAVSNADGTDYASTAYTDQEVRTGIHLRKVKNGSIAASDNYGLGYHVWGGTPHEALVKLYELLTGKIPYSNSGDVQ